MKLGTFDTFHRPDHLDNFPLLLGNLREQTDACEALGYHSIWLGEHYFNHVGIDPMPNPLMLGADLATRTKRLRIGQACLCLPFWHPVRVAEDVALLDQLSGGRVEVGIGKGTRPREGLIFHEDADPRRKPEQNALFNEILDVMIKAWTEEFFSHEGPNFSFPPPGTPWTHPMIPPDERWFSDGQVTKICMLPKCVQQPHPPLWMVSDSDHSIDFAASRSINGIIWQPPIPMLREKFMRYRDKRSAAEGRELRLGEGMALMKAVYVAPTMEEARADTEAGILHLFNWVHPKTRGLEIFRRPDEDDVPWRDITWEFLMERDNLLIGDPDSVAEQVATLRDELSLEYLFTYTNVPWLENAKILRSLDLMANEVMPKVEGR